MNTLSTEGCKEEVRQNSRRWMRENKETLSSKAFVNRLNELLDLSSTKVAAFRALPGEPDLTDLFEINWSAFVFPKVDGVTMSFKSAHKDQFEQGELGIMEPTGESVSLSECQSMLIPGLAFDRCGMRLGRGRGYYDKALSNFSGKKIGVCFSSLMSNRSLPTEEHDMGMDLIVTEAYTFQPILRKGH